MNSNVSVNHALLVPVPQTNINFVTVFRHDLGLEVFVSDHSLSQLCAEPTLEAPDLGALVRCEAKLERLIRIPELLNTGPLALALEGGLAKVLW